MNPSFMALPVASFILVGIGNDFRANECRVGVNTPPRNLLGQQSILTSRVVCISKQTC